MATSETEADRPMGDGPAPRHRGPLGYVVIAVVCAVAALGWAYVMGTMGGSPGITAQTVSYRVLDDSTVEIGYSVRKSKDRPVRCELRALDERFREIGRREVDLPRGTDQVRRTDRIATSARATAAEVHDCHPL